ncbi:uncharacterized protein LOC118430100 [Branchiostoma floridae]|uniref:Uncharacterized protein LOC118430100 n=1 Tax=Branchiostoma floridae TaxID=7739 RepID=A0A9J7M8Q7_BRAFL|nr:uncharacterized protein LOC118430100 [Branchiostoma floridae]
MGNWTYSKTFVLLYYAVMWPSPNVYGLTKQQVGRLKSRISEVKAKIDRITGRVVHIREHTLSQRLDITLPHVGCPVGTYYNHVSGEATCDVCPVGSYQDKEGQTECIRCEPGFFTAGNNSKNATDCRSQCQPGTFSETGLETCMFCPKGTYQNQQGATECIPCEEGTTTVDVGTVDREGCGKVSKFTSTVYYLEVISIICKTNEDNFIGNINVYGITP